LRGERNFKDETKEIVFVQRKRIGKKEIEVLQEIERMQNNLCNINKSLEERGKFDNTKISNLL